MGDVANILIGAVTVRVAPTGTAEPNYNQNPLVWTGWTDVGWTDGGVELEYTPEFTDVFVDQELPPVLTELTAEQAVVRVPLAEATLQNLNKAISASAFSQVPSGAGVTAKDILKVGSGAVVETMLAVEGKSPEGFWRAFVFWRTIVASPIGQAYRKAEKVLFPTEFKALSDPTKPVGERLFKATDMTAAAI